MVGLKVTAILFDMADFAQWHSSFGECLLPTGLPLLVFIRLLLLLYTCVTLQVELADVQDRVKVTKAEKPRSKLKSDLREITAKVPLNLLPVPNVRDLLPISIPSPSIFSLPNIAAPSEPHYCSSCS